jgi:hypothetical protein
MRLPMPVEPAIKSRRLLWRFFNQFVIINKIKQMRFHHRAPVRAEHELRDQRSETP